MQTKRKQLRPYTLKTRNWIIFGSVCGGVFALLLIIGAFCDWQISWALAKPFLPVNTSGQYYTNNVYANFIEVMGVPILDFILSSAMLVVFFNTLRIRNINLRRLCGAITFCFAFCFAFIAFGSDLFHFLSEVIFGKKQKPTSSAKDLEYLLSIVFAACFMFAMVSAFHRVTAATMQLLMKWVYIVFVATFFGYFFIEIIKNQFPRMRFRAIIAFENGSERDLQSYFHQWYELGYNPSNIHILDNNPLFLVSGMRSSADQFKSFPSGHVSYSAVALSLCTLPMIVPKFNTWKYKLLWWAVPVLWVIMVIFGRVSAGAHYFSDGVIGALMSCTAVLIAYILLDACPYTKTLDRLLARSDDKTIICQTMIPLVLPLFFLILAFLMMHGTDWSKYL